MTNPSQQETLTLPGSDQVEEAVRDILIQELDLEPGELTPAGSFVDTYDADSLTLITVVTRIEKLLGIRIPGDRHAEMTTLESLLAVVGDVRAAGRDND